MKILITGAAGFIARALVRDLEARGHEPVLLDRVDPATATVFVPGSADRAQAPLDTRRHRYLRAEIGDLDAMTSAVAGCDAVVHLAAAVSGDWAVAVPTFSANALGTFTVLEACRRGGVRRFGCASSINAFGTFYWRVSGRPSPYTVLPLREDAPTAVEDAYSLGKLVGEEVCATFTRAWGMTTAAFRFAAVAADPLIDAWRKEAPPAAWSDDLWQWVHIDDVAAGLVDWLVHPAPPAHGVYTLGAGDTRVREPTMDLLRRLRPDLAAQVRAPIAGRDPLLAIDRARAAFGYAPRHRMHP